MSIRDCPWTGSHLENVYISNASTSWVTIPFSRLYDGMQDLILRIHSAMRVPQFITMLVTWRVVESNTLSQEDVARELQRAERLFISSARCYRKQQVVNNSMRHAWEAIFLLKDDEEKQSTLVPWRPADWRTTHCLNPMMTVWFWETKGATQSIVHTSPLICIFTQWSLFTASRRT